MNNSYKKDIVKERTLNIHCRHGSLLTFGSPLPHPYHHHHPFQTPGLELSLERFEVFNSIIIWSPSSTAETIWSTSSSIGSGVCRGLQPHNDLSPSSKANLFGREVCRGLRERFEFEVWVAAPEMISFAQSHFELPQTLDIQLKIQQEIQLEVQ